MLTLMTTDNIATPIACDNAYTARRLLEIARLSDLPLIAAIESDELSLSKFIKSAAKSSRGTQAED